MDFQANHRTKNRIPLKDIHAFHELTRSLASSFDLDTILHTILEYMEHIIPAELWTLLMIDEARQELYYVLAADGKEDALRDLRVKVGEGVAGWVAKHGEALIIPEISETGSDDGSRKAPDSRLAEERMTRLRFSQAEAWGRHPVKQIQLHSVIALPLRGRKGTHGVIEILNPSADHLDDYAIAFLHILADHAAIAIENAHDVERIQQLTITDDTTGLFNVRYLYQVLERELERARQLDIPLSLAFIDLDSFKIVNDEHGHLVGSELLALIGKRLRELGRKQDWCFRYGGDEFVILMVGTPASDAFSHIAKLHHELLHSRFILQNGLDLAVSASIGLATAPADGSTVHDILGVADSRMYEVKLTGRGKIIGTYRQD